MADVPRFPLYRQIDLLGVGASAQTYLASRCTDDRLCALKVFVTSPDARGQFLDELEVLSELSHPSIVRLIDFGTTLNTGQDFLALEYVAGDDFVSASRRFSSHEFYSMVAQVLRGLNYLHLRGRVHGDLKPSNIMVTRGPDPGVSVPCVKIIDLGLTRVATRNETAEIAGSLHYAAPEVLRGAGATPASDLYSFGAILYECLAGSPPFPGATVNEIVQAHLDRRPGPLPARASPELHSLILRLLSKDPLERPTSAADLLTRLRTLAPSAPLLHYDSDSLSGLLDSCPLVGRERTLEEATELLRSCLVSGMEPRITVVIVRGATGTGKSRVLRTLSVRARALGFRVLNLGTVQPLPAILEQLGTAVASRGGGPTAGPYLVTLDDPAQPITVLRQLEVLLRSELPAPLALILTASAHLVSEADLGEWVGRLRAPSTGSTLCIDPLSVAEVGKVICQALHTSPVEPSIEATFHDLTGGNPLLLTRALIASFDQDILCLDGSTLIVRRSPRERLAPQVFTDPLLPALQRLRPEEYDLLTSLSVAACSLSISALECLTNRPAAHVAGLLERLVEYGLLRIGPKGYVPISPLLAHALSDAVMAPHAREIHTQLGGCLSSADDLPSLEEAARQYALAEEFSRAITTAQRAAGLASEQGNRRSEVNSYRLILDHCRPQEDVRIETKLRLIRSLRQAGDPGQALTSAEALLMDPSLTQRQRLDLLSQHSACALDVGDYALRVRSARQVLRLARKIGSDQDLLNAQVDLGIAFCFTDRRAAGRRLLHRAARHARRLGNRHFIANANYALAASCWQEGDYRLALRYERRRYALLRAVDPRAAAYSLENIGILLSDQGFFTKAQRCHTEVINITQRTSMTAPRLTSLVNLADTFRSLGRMKKSLTYCMEVLDGSRESGLGHVHVTAEGNIGVLFTLFGYYKHALDHLRHLLFRSRKLGSTTLKVPVLANWSLLLSAVGRFEASRRVAAHACRLVHASKLWQSMLECKALMSAALADLGHRSEAAALLSEALAKYEERSPFEVRIRSRLLAAGIDLESGAAFDAIEARIGPLIATARRKKMRWHLATGLMIRGDAFLADSRAAEAETAVQEAMAIARKNGDRTLFWQGTQLLGKACEQMLRYERALGYYRMAALTVQELAMNIEEERYRASFLGQPRVRTVLEGYDRLRREVGRKAKYDLAALNRSEHISRRMLGALSTIGQRLASILDLDELMASVLDLAIENVRAERGIIFLLDPVTGEMNPGCARGMDREALSEVTSYSRSVLQRATQGQTILTVDVGKDPTLSGYQSLILHEIKSILCVPMRARGKVAGVIYLDTRRGPQLFTDKERAFVDSFASQAAIAIENARLFGDMNAENARLRRQAEDRAGFSSLIGTSPVMVRLTETLRGVAGSECSVLICGESGTGKEIVARAIHYNGQRRKKKFVAIDCGALPESLLESELFGYARGAFTGADRERVGLIEEATGGTLFLDEVTNTTPALQAKLLRVIQEGEVRRLGENAVRRVDLRIVAATNADIQALVREGRFRQDLYYRLNVITIDVPPLRERREDVPLLASHFLRAHARDGAPAKRLGPGVATVLSRYDWPGNVRELENLMERLVALVPSRVVSVSDLPDPIRPASATAGPSPASRSVTKSGEQMMIEDALRRCGGDKAKAARFIGWNRQKLYRRMREFGIPIDFGQAA